MYLRKCQRKKRGREHVYWELVESYRTERGPRQRVVAYLGDMEGGRRRAVASAASEGVCGVQSALFEEDLEPSYEEVDTKRIRVERVRDFGGYWLGLWVLEKLGLLAFLKETLPSGREEVPWWVMSLVLVLCRLQHPSSELQIAQLHFGRSALGDLLGIGSAQVNDDRLYRALDALLGHKEALERHLRERLGSLFGVEFDLLLYDVTSTYFEGEAAKNELAQRGYSRDHRPDCKQVCIALVVSGCGLPLGYEVFAGNRSDVTTVEAVVCAIEARWGKAERIWVMDRGMISEENLAYLRSGERRYIVGTPRGQLKAFERELLEGEWTTIREGLEVKLCSGAEGAETFILCRSQARKEKEKAIHARFEQRIEEGLVRMAETCRKSRVGPGVLERRVGRLLGQNSRAAGLFVVKVGKRPDGGATLEWEKKQAWRAWAELSEGCYLLRTNITGWTAEELWQAYIQLTQAEAAFRIHKSDLSIRPIWHQKSERVQAHILVCFLAYVIWKTLGQLGRAAGLGDEPRRIFDDLSQIKMVDVILRTKTGVPIRRRCIAQPDKHQSILLDRLRLRLPRQLRIAEDVV